MFDLGHILPQYHTAVALVTKRVFLRFRSHSYKQILFLLVLEWGSDESIVQPRLRATSLFLKRPYYFDHSYVLPVNMLVHKFQFTAVTNQHKCDILTCTTFLTGLNNRNLTFLLGWNQGTIRHKCFKNMKDFLLLSVNRLCSLACSLLQVSKASRITFCLCGHIVFSNQCSCFNKIMM